MRRKEQGRRRRIGEKALDGRMWFLGLMLFPLKDQPINRVDYVLLTRPGPGLETGVTSLQEGVLLRENLVLGGRGEIVRILDPGGLASPGLRLPLGVKWG